MGTAEAAISIADAFAVLYLGQRWIPDFFFFGGGGGVRGGAREWDWANCDPKQG